MRMNRLLLALAPILLGACSDDSSATATTAGTNGTAGPTSGDGTAAGTTQGTTDGTATSTDVSTSTTAGPVTTTDAMGATTTGTSSTTASTTSAGTTDAGTTGSGGAASTSGTTSMGGSSGSGGTSGTPTCPYTPPDEPDSYPENWTSSELTVFNNNGGWTWYNDERVVVDAEGGKIVVGSAASSASSQTADTSINVVIHDIASGMNDKATVGSLSYSDDHNNPGIVVTAPNQYFAAWAHHNQDCNSYWSSYSGSWSNAVTHSWSPQGCPWGASQSHVTYNNVWKMSSEGRYYNFVRSVDTSPNFLVSENDGATWSFAGRLTASPQQGYNAGYYKYWGNGVDRIDFFATEAHPRDADTSVFHGYIEGGKTYDSNGVEQDDDIFDTSAPGITDFTRVFGAGQSINGVTLNALWNFDIARYADGTIGVLWQGRIGARGKDNTNPQHRILYSRFDGSTWTSTYLVRGGRTLYRDMSDWWEEDYLGGAALDPDDPHVIYVSTPIDPRDDSTDVGNHEIWKGVTCDDGATFQWTPMTMNSANENLRPVVPKWDANNTALLWFRGNYQTAQMYSAEVVGLITQQ